MKSQRWAWSGWMVAAGLLGIMIGSGFQTPSVKLGVVDLNAVIDRSDLGVSNQKTFAEMKKAREALLEFMDEYRVLTVEQAKRLRELMLKLDRSKAEDAEIERIKSEIVTSSKRSLELSTKTSLTPEDRTLVEEYSRRSQTINDLSVRWLQEFSNEMRQWVDGQRQVAYEKAKASVNEIAAKEGYSLVMESSVAVYGANDLSEATLATMNAKK